MKRILYILFAFNLILIIVSLLHLLGSLVDVKFMNEDLILNNKSLNSIYNSMYISFALNAITIFGNLFLFLFKSRNKI